MGTIDRQIEAVQQADSAGKLVKAVAELSACKNPEAIPTLIEVLGFNNPGAAVAAVDGLVALGDVAAQALLENIDDYNYTARAWVLRALALLGDPSALDLLKETAETDFSLSVRRAAAKGLGSVKWEKLALDDRIVAQQQALETLQRVQQDPEWVVRYAGLAGLAALAAQAASPEILATVRDHLEKVSTQEKDLVVKARAVWTLASI